MPVLIREPAVLPSGFLRRPEPARRIAVQFLAGSRFDLKELRFRPRSGPRRFAVCTRALRSRRQDTTWESAGSGFRGAAPRGPARPTPLHSRSTPHILAPLHFAPSQASARSRRLPRPRASPKTSAECGSLRATAGFRPLSMRVQFLQSRSSSRQHQQRKQKYP